MSFDEYRKKVLRVREQEKSQIRNSYGIKDAYRWCIKNKLIGKHISERDFRIIINTINEAIADKVVEGCKVKLPASMGNLFLMKEERGSEFRDGKLVITMPVDWISTMKLWYEDEDAKEKKTLVRHESREVYRVMYDSGSALYKNKTYFRFTPVRAMKLKLKKAIQNNKTDALLKYRYYGIHKCRKSNGQNHKTPSSGGHAL